MSTEPELSTIRSSEKGYSLSFTICGALKIRSRCSSTSSSFSWGCLQNQPLAKPQFPNEDVDLVESAWSPGGGARSRAPHVSGLTPLSCISGSKDNWVKTTDASVGPITKKRLSSSATTLPPSYSSVSNGFFCGAHFLLFHCRLYPLFQMCGAQHAANSAPCAPVDPKRRLVL